jgi:hypothetical protein
MRSPCYLCVDALKSTSECLNQSSPNLVCISWHLSPSQRHTSYIPPISLCLYMCPSYRCQAKARLNVSLLSALGNGSVNMFLRQGIQATREELLDSSFSMLSASYQKESLWVCLCIPLSLLCNNSVKTFPRQRRIVGRVVFNAVSVVSKESRQLVRSRISCFYQSC